MALCLAGACCGAALFAQAPGGGASGASSGGSAGGTGGAAGSSAEPSAGPGSTAPGGTKSGTPSGTLADPFGVAPGAPSGTTTKPGGTPSGTLADPFGVAPGAPSGTTTTTKPSGTGTTETTTKPGATPPAGAGTTTLPGTAPAATPPLPGQTPDTTTPETPPKPTKPTKPTGAGASTTFGAGTGTGTTPATPEGETPSGEGPEQREAPPAFSLPGFYGTAAPTTFKGGEGRLARPKFRFNINLAQGYDDNVLQTPDDPLELPDQVVVIDPGTPDTVVFVPVTRTVYVQSFAGPIVYYRPVTTTTLERRVIEGRDPVVETIQAPDPQERTGSLVSRAAFAFDAQIFTKRSLFTLDLNGSIDRYWNRPGIESKDDFAGAVAFNYIYNFTPRLTFSAAANVAYISQPDLTRANTPERVGAGDVVNSLARVNLAYRLTPRISATLSLGQNALFYTQRNATGLAATDLPGANPANGDNFQTTGGMELRYLWKPRVTLLGEFRHVLITYPDRPELDATSDILLFGAELRLTSRLFATLRLGQSIRTFDQSGDSSMSPHGEGTVTYQLTPTSRVNWDARFGFEEPPSPETEVLSFRSSLSYLKNFTPRLSLGAAMSGVHRITQFSGSGDDVVDQIFDASITLEYRVTRTFSLNATFTFIRSISTTDELNYDRNRVFIGAEYTF
jgi:hypothetical protein